MTKKRFTWKTVKLQHLNDEVLMVVDNENKDWEGHILNIVGLLNKLYEENERLKSRNSYNVEDAQMEIGELKEENEQLKERLYDFEKRKIIEESEIDEDVIPKVKLLRTELFGEKYERETF